MKYFYRNNPLKRPMETLETYRCGLCHEHKPREHFYWYNTGHRGYCKPCAKAKAVAWNREGKRYLTINRRHILRRYGMSEDDYKQLLHQQGYACAICGVSFGGVTGWTKTLHLDHCHTEGAPRAILCKRCNTGLGHWEDNPELLRRAAEYIERYRD